jgi:hypothetical protein
MNRLCSGNALKLQASRKVGGLNLSQFFVNSLNSSTLISGYTSIRLIRLPLNRVQIIIQPYTYHRWYDIQLEKHRPS